ncbi:hypothetical protein D8B26_007571 [Coccidioides posadasii str. Silveira]|uniref:tRNA wybutosine-synthesizing protein 2 n=1 Tax=Coccidioides posadasii (strain RMSCC 757 / Silveira) TaxID=443226 RepID=E9D2B8_COCPS|nr:conserved hypothetical protein [Coccidioides posadasii str. Silveira]QVM12954.1 hypothetical protein D8B26_007571 [Coccidioides posadasii str. Silveira]
MNRLSHIDQAQSLDDQKEKFSSKSFSTSRVRHKQRNRANPLQRGIEEFLTSHISSSFLIEHNIPFSNLISSLPKRYTIYPPLLLLPQNTFNSDPHWKRLLSSFKQDQLNTLYACIAAAFSAQGVTHIATNAPIALTKGDSGDENRMRSPTGVTPLYGDFGHLPADPDTGKEENPSASDLQSAFWVQAVQNSGIIQIWAPLFSMFSRGNIIEKARILGAASTFEGLTEAELGQKLKDIAVVDMYAGIGYFVFSYLKRGVGRVWAWELNGWSIEGLKRGAQANCWKIKSVRVDSSGSVEGLDELIEGLSDEDRVVAFHGDNRFAARILSQVKERLERKGAWKSIRHVNLGLLPTSQDSWEGAVGLLDHKYQGWAHVHENVAVDDIDEKSDYIVHEFESLLQSARKTRPSSSSNSAVECRAVERVKTYAPGVMHCVFDIRVPQVVTMGISRMQNP